MIKKSTTLTKNVSCKCMCKFDIIQSKCRIMINIVASAKNIFEKDFIWSPDTCSCKNGKYLASIIDGSVIVCDEIIGTDAKAIIIFICFTKTYHIVLPNHFDFLPNFLCTTSETMRYYYL